MHNHVYEDIASKFFEHFLSIAGAINGVGDEKCLGLWDETDQFYYDHLSLPDGENLPVKIQSAVGLIPLFAVQPADMNMVQHLPEFAGEWNGFLSTVRNWPASFPTGTFPEKKIKYCSRCCAAIA